MNMRVLMVVALLLVGAGALVAAALLAGTTPEFTVGRLTRGEWPPADAPADVVRRQEVKLTGFCVKYDQAVDPYTIEVGEVSPEAWTDTEPQPTVTIHIVNTVPEGLNFRSKVFATGHYDPDTGIFSAHTVTATCPSTEQDKFEASQVQ